MGTRLRNLANAPATTRSASMAPHNRHIWLPASNASAVAQTQAFSTLAGNALATSTSGIATPLINPILLTGTGTHAVIDPNAADRGVYLPYPSPITFTTTDTGGTAKGTFVYQLRIRGVTHLGRRITRIENKTNTGGSAAPYLLSQDAWAWIDTIEVLSWAGLSTDKILCGYLYDFVATGGGSPLKRIPLPYEVASGSDIVGVTWEDVGGATWSSTAWAAGDFVALSTATGDLQGNAPQNLTGAVACFNLGRATTPPTSVSKFIVHTKFDKLV